MRFSFLRTAVAGFGALLAVTGGAMASESPAGLWLNDTGRGAVEIKPCGEALCGHVVWVRDASDQKGCGRQVIGEARSMGSGVWDNGWIYSPERRKTYDVELKPLADGTLRVKGYAGTKLFSKTMIWKPAPANLERCDKTAAAPASAPPAEAKTASTDAPAPAVIEKTPPVAAPAPAAKDAGAPVATPPPVAAEAPQNPEKQAPGPEVADAPEGDQEGEGDGKRIDLGALTERLAELERETGYGLKKTADGDCRLKVPFATVRFRCDE